MSFSSLFEASFFQRFNIETMLERNLTTRGKVQRVSKERGAIATQSILVVIDAAAYIVFIDSRCSFFFIPIFQLVTLSFVIVRQCSAAYSPTLVYIGDRSAVDNKEKWGGPD